MANKIKTARKANGLSQAELGKRTGTDQAHISRLENGETGASTQVLAAIAHELGMTLSELIGDDIHAAKQGYGKDHPATKILQDKNAPQGLKDLAVDTALASAMRITEDEWKTLRSIKLDKSISKDGYTQLLITLRAIS